MTALIDGLGPNGKMVVVGAYARMTSGKAEFRVVLTM